MNPKFILTRGVVVFVLTFLFLVAGGGISHNDSWRVTEIRILGTQVVSSDAMRLFVQEKLAGNYYFVYARDNSYLFSRHDIETGLLKKFLILENATVNKVDNHTIEVVVLERKAFALWCGEIYNDEKYDLNNCWFIDKTGFVFGRAPTFSKGVYPEVYGKLEMVRGDNLSGARLSPVRFNFVQAVEKNLREKLGEPLRMIIKNEEEYGVTMRTSTTYPQVLGAEIRFKDGAPADALIKTLLSALPVQFPSGAPSDKKLLYIDLRFGNKVFFGF